jgi:hypothetical protein
MESHWSIPLIRTAISFSTPFEETILRSSTMISWTSFRVILPWEDWLAAAVFCDAVEALEVCCAKVNAFASKKKSKLRKIVIVASSYRRANSGSVLI